MKIFLIRHGETNWNVEGRFQGREDIPLNGHGIQQAQLCGEALRGIPFEMIITSPLIRARETARIIAVKANIPVMSEEGLIEREYGKISGLNQEERELFYQSGRDSEMEPWGELSNRMLSCIKEYALRFYPGNIIMISHGAAINSTISILTEGEAGTGKTRLKNTCINIISFNGHSMELEQYNKTWEEFLQTKDSYIRK